MIVDKVAEVEMVANGSIGEVRVVALAEETGSDGRESGNKWWWQWMEFELWRMVKVRWRWRER